MIKLLLKGDYEKFEKSLTTIKDVCGYCDNKMDCIGIEDCYPDSKYYIIEYTLRNPRKKEITNLAR